MYSRLQFINQNSKFTPQKEPSTSTVSTTAAKSSNSNSNPTSSAASINTPIPTATRPSSKTGIVSITAPIPAHNIGPATKANSNHPPIAAVTKPNVNNNDSGVPKSTSSTDVTPATGTTITSDSSSMDNSAGDNSNSNDTCSNTAIRTNNIEIKQELIAAGQEQPQSLSGRGTWTPARELAFMKLLTDYEPYRASQGTKLWLWKQICCEINRVDPHKTGIKYHAMRSKRIELFKRYRSRFIKRRNFTRRTGINRPFPNELEEQTYLAWYRYQSFHEASQATKDQYRLQRGEEQGVKEGLYQAGGEEGLGSLVDRRELPNEIGRNTAPPRLAMSEPMDGSVMLSDHDSEATEEARFSAEDAAINTAFHAALLAPTDEEDNGDDYSVVDDCDYDLPVNDDGDIDDDVMALATQATTTRLGKRKRKGRIPAAIMTARTTTARSERLAKAISALERAEDEYEDQRQFNERILTSVESLANDISSMKECIVDMSEKFSTLADTMVQYFARSDHQSHK